MLKLFLGKLKSKCSGPFTVKEIRPYGTIEIEDPKIKINWVVNGHSVTIYHGGDFERHYLNKTQSSLMNQASS